MKRYAWLGAALVAAAALAGCQAASGGADKGARVNTELAPNLADYHVKKVAVLGYANTTGDEEAGKMADYLVGALSGTGKYYFAPATTLARDAERKGVSDDYDRLLSLWQKTRALDKELVGTLLEATGYDALAAIDISRWEEVKIPPTQEGTSNTTVGVRVEMVAPDGTLLWAASDLKTEKSPPYNPDFNTRSTVSGQARTTSSRAVPEPPPIDNVAVTVAKEVAETLPTIPAGDGGSAQ